MQDSTPTPDPTSDNLPPSPSSLPPGTPPVPAKPKTHRRRWLKAILIVIAGILIFIAILPTLLSMGWARHIVENKANDQLHGKLQIRDWSLGWFTGTKIGPIDLHDASGKPVLQVASVDTHLSLADVLRGKFNLGKVPVTGLRLYVTREPDGRLNIQNLLPPTSPSKPAPPSEHPTPSAPARPSKLPNISVDLVLSDCKAIFTDAKTGKSVTFPISGTVNIPNINQPITNALQIAIQSNGVTDGTISLNGSVAAIHDNQIDSNQPDVDETFKIAGLDLSAFQPIVANAFATLSGHGDGEFSLKLTPHQAGALNGGLTVSDIKANGPATKGDTFAADSLVVTCANELPTADGLDALATSAGRFKAENSIALQQGSSKSTISFNADSAISALNHLVKNLAPGSDGKVELAASIDLAHWANALPHLFNLKPGISLDGGQLIASAGVAMTATDATPSASLLIDHVAGKKAGKAFALKPITVTGSATDLGGGGAMPKLQNLKASLSSAFATGTLTAPTPSQITGQFHAQLADMQTELGQIIDFGSTAVRGSIAANISSQGDLAEGDSAGGSDKIHGTLTASDILVDRGKAAPINIPSANYALAATLVRGPSLSITKVTGLSLSGTVGPADRPALASDCSTDLTIGKDSSIVASNVNVTGSLNVPELRHELGTAAADKIPADYTLKLVLGATAAFSNAGSSVAIPSFAITDNHGLISVGLAPGKGIRYATGESRQKISPTGTLAISADLAEIDAMLTTPTKDSAIVKAGRLDGTLALGGDSQLTQLQEDFRAVGITILAGTRTTPLSPLELKQTVAFGPGDQLTVSDFSAQGAGSELHLKQPLVVQMSDLRSPAIDAELVGSGDIAQAMQFINAFKPAPPLATYTGKYMLDQTVATTAGVIAAKGSVQGSFTVQNPGMAEFSEPIFSLVNDLSYDQPHDSVALKTLTLDMHGSGALRLVARGTIADLTTTRTMQGVSADLHYDAAGLWKLIYATLTPDQQRSYADVKVTGIVDRHFLVAGSYPANQPFNVAVQSLTVQGGIALTTFAGEGMSIANLDLPLSLRAGQFFIAEPKPATMNDGTLSLNGITVDLSDPHERLSIPDGTAVLKNVSLNAVFVKNAAGWVNNPLFVGEDKAAGVLNLTIDHCHRLPTDDLLKATTADNDGAFHMHMTLGRVQLGAPMLADVSKAIGPLLGGRFQVPSLQGEIPNYSVEIAKGIMTTDMTMNLSDKKRPLHLGGTVALASKKLNMLLELPTGLLGGDKGPLVQIAGDQLKIPITGTTDHPKFDVKSLLQKNLKNPGNDLKNIFKGIGG